MGILNTLRTMISNGNIEPEKTITPIDIHQKAAGTDILSAILEMKFADSITSASAKLLQANREWVYINNRKIAKEVATIDFELYTVKSNKGEIEMERVYEHEILSLLDKFNEATSKADGIYLTQSHKKLAGDSFWLLDNEHIYNLDPTKVDIELGDFTKSGDSRLIKAYKYKAVIKGKEIEKIYEPDEIIQFKEPDPSNMYRGLGAVEALAQSIDIDNLANEINKKFFEQGAITNFVLSTDGRITDSQLKRLRAELRANYGGARNAYKAMILSGGLKPESIRMSNKDMELIAQLEWYRDKIISVFENNKAVLGITNDVNRANAEATIKLWKEATVRPEMAAIVNTLNEFLVPKYGDNLILSFANPVGEDIDQKADLNIKLFNAGLISQNEARQAIGFDEVEGGDSFKFTLSGLNQNNAPEPLKYIDYQKVFRRMNIEKKRRQQEFILSVSRDMAKKLVTSKQHEPISNQFSDEKVRSYYDKVMLVTDKYEERMENLIGQFDKELEEEAVSTMSIGLASKNTKAKLIEEEKAVSRAKEMFEPLLAEIALSAGTEASKLIGLDTPIIISERMRKAILRQIDMFATSTVANKKRIMADIIAEGVANGRSIPEIERAMRDKFGDLTMTDRKRITRTEVLRTQNESSQNTWIESGLVYAKQWLTSPSPDWCEALNGKIVDIEQNFFDKGDSIGDITLDYDDVGYPPIHPNCTCTIIPVLIDSKQWKPQTDKIKELEAQIDMRTKEYREIKQLKEDQDAYISALEELIENE